MSMLSVYDIGQHYIDLRNSGITEKEVGRHLSRFVESYTLKNKDGWPLVEVPVSVSKQDAYNEEE